MGKRNATIEFCQVRHVVHKHELQELTMTRTLSKPSGLFEFIYFCLSFMNILSAVTNFISFRVIFRKFCIYRFFCPSVYIRWYTSPNENFGYSYPHSNALLQFHLKLEFCKLISSNKMWCNWCQTFFYNTVANFWCYPIRRCLTKASALELTIFAYKNVKYQFRSTGSII